LRKSSSARKGEESPKIKGPRDVWLVIRPDLPQLLVVCAAFFTLSLLSYFYASNVMKKQVDLYSRSEMQVHHAAIRSLLNAHEAALEHAAAAVVYAVEHGAGPEELQGLLKTLDALFASEKDMRGVFGSVFGYVKGNYLDGTGWIPHEYFYPKSAPWIRSTVLTGGLHHIRPYLNPRNQEHVASVSMVIYDSKGESLGVLAIDYLLNPIIEQVRDYRVTDAGYGLLLDDSFSILTCPYPEYIGKRLDEFPGFEGIYRELSPAGPDGKPVAQSVNPEAGYRVIVERVNAGGEDNIAFFSSLENGWHVGVVVPYRYYYSEVYRMIPVISLFSLVMAAMVCVILIRMSLAKRRSEDESHAKTTFLARMSHEIRTPMNAIMGMCELARRNMGKPEALEYLGEIRHAGADLLSIINDILDYTKINTGKITLNDVPYNTANLFYDTLAIIKVRLGTKEIDLSYEMDPSMPGKLKGDEVRVRQVILNLLTNAVKYTPQGFIKFSLGFEISESELIRLRIRVADSGVGIKKEDLGALFGDFVRLNQAAGIRHIEGTGLGLAITRSLCNAMGGDIKVESDFGKGTVFTATLEQTVYDWKPVGLLNPFDRRTPDGQDEEGDELVSFEAPGLPTLVVDDIETNLVVSKGLLSPYGLEVTTCVRGVEAVELSKKNRYELIFIDHMMPEMSGGETMKRIREESELNRDVPMIALTAAVMAGMEEEFLADGFNDFLGKPIELKKLHAILERWVPLEKRVKPGKKPKGGKDKALSSLGFEIEGVDLEEGLRRIGGDANVYLKALSIFCKDASDRLNLFSSVSMENKRDFEIMSHAVKSAAANIGALALSKEAKLLEDAARKGDLYTIRSRYPNFQKLLSLTTVRIKEALRQKDEAAPVPEAGPRPASGEDSTGAGVQNFEAGTRKGNSSGGINVEREILLSLKEAIESRDIGAIDRILDSLTARRNDTETRETLERISNHVLLADFDEAGLLVDIHLTRERAPA
jgi:signal transduction histidine kinase/CheY-like chemotaxis protein/HPt (histidine-containing phosphotransfer) domain-containing protein